MKIDVSPIIKSHLKTLRSDEKGRRSYFDFSIFFGVPIVLGFVVYDFRIEFFPAFYPIALSFFGVFLAILMNVQIGLLSVYQKEEIAPADPKLIPSFHTKLANKREVIRETNFNVSYLMLFCLLSFPILMYFCTDGISSASRTAISVSLFVHFFLSFLMTAKRSFVLFSYEFSKN